MARLRQVQNILDTRAKAKVDPAYIEVPDKPWRVILRYKENVVDVDYNQSLDFPETNEHSDVRLCFEPPLAASVGVWVGYRGLGFSISQSLARNAGRYYSISSTGARYGFNFRLRRFNTGEARFQATDYKDGKLNGVPYDTVANMLSPVWIRSVYVNGYYVFNGRHYSQAAAYNQSVIQRRSAGSFLLGLTWYQSSFDYSNISNFLYMIISDGISRIKVHQANLGVGYGYNWVFAKNCVFNASLLPAIGYKKSRAFNGNESSTDQNIFHFKWVRNVNVDLIGRAGFVWNNSKFFVGANIVTHTYDYRKDYFSLTNSYAVLRLYAGFNFLKKK
jgi:hypothetical protein